MIPLAASVTLLLSEVMDLSLMKIPKYRIKTSSFFVITTGQCLSTAIQLCNANVNCYFISEVQKCSFCRIFFIGHNSAGIGSILPAAGIFRIVKEIRNRRRRNTEMAENLAQDDQSQTFKGLLYKQGI
jgi:hypothetical protein